MIEKFGNYWFDIDDIIAIKDESQAEFNPINPDNLIIIVFLHDNIQIYLEGEEARRCLEKFKKSKEPRILDKKPV